jgi:hypothetical protein
LPNSKITIQNKIKGPAEQPALFDRYSMFQS